jgi:hypothetical protein
MNKFISTCALVVGSVLSCIFSSAAIAQGRLADPTGGLTLGSNSRVTFVSATCPWGETIGGSCIPPPQAGQGQVGCYAFGSGPCGSYEILKPGSCPASTNRAYQHSSAMPALQGNLNFGSQKFFTIPKNDVVIFTFVTPTVVEPGVNTAISFDNNAFGAEAIKYVSLSTTRCDSAQEKFTNRDPCFQTGNQTGLEISISNTPDPQRCSLRPNTRYYLTLRGDCLANQCGYLINGPTLLFPK